MWPAPLGSSLARSLALIASRHVCLQDDEDDEEPEGEEEGGAGVRTGGMDVDAGEEAADDGIPVQARNQLINLVNLKEQSYHQSPCMVHPCISGCCCLCVWLPALLGASGRRWRNGACSPGMHVCGTPCPPCPPFLLVPAPPLQPALQEIDAYWLQRRVSKAFGDIDPNAAQKLAEDVFEALQVGSWRGSVSVFLVGRAGRACLPLC